MSPDTWTVMTDPDSWTIDVDFSTHDALKTGQCVTGTHRVTVLADTEAQAHLIACEMVSCHAMPTGSRFVSVVC